MSHTPLDAETERLLQRYGFDRERFEALRERLRTGAATPESNWLKGTIEVPRPGDVEKLPAPGSAEREELARIGRDAIRSGQVGVVVLAGGMATRFGGVVKAGVEAIEGQTFLDLKLRDVASIGEKCGGRVPVYLMTSFATDDEVSRLGAERTSSYAPVRTFPQFVSLRLTPDGELFRGDDGQVSPYAPGHGDVPFALRSSGCLDQFRQQGGELLFMSNVDNLAATLDPAVIGFHRASGAEITSEVVTKDPGDKGGAPARVDGKLQVIESFRFPKSFDEDRIDVFNVNSFVFEADRLDRDFPLDWFAVQKKVDGRPAVQFERLVGQVTAFLETKFLHVEREGPDGRFQPVKDPEELAQRADAIRAILEARGVL